MLLCSADGTSSWRPFVHKSTFSNVHAQPSLHSTSHCPSTQYRAIPPSTLILPCSGSPSLVHCLSQLRQTGIHLIYNVLSLMSRRYLDKERSVASLGPEPDGLLAIGSGDIFDWFSNRPSCSNRLELSAGRRINYVMVHVSCREVIDIVCYIP